MGNINAMRNTVSLMLSDDWQERFVAEYRQLETRIESLGRMINNWDELSFHPNCSKRTLEIQLEHMNNYFESLKVRASIENINLDI